MPYYNRDPKRDHKFDNHPYDPTGFRDSDVQGFEFLIRASGGFKPRVVLGIDGFFEFRAGACFQGF